MTTVEVREWPIWRYKPPKPMLDQFEYRGIVRGEQVLIYDEGCLSPHLKRVRVAEGGTAVELVHQFATNRYATAVVAPLENDSKLSVCVWSTTNMGTSYMRIERRWRDADCATTAHVFAKLCQGMCKQDLDGCVIVILRQMLGRAAICKILNVGN